MERVLCFLEDQLHEKKGIEGKRVFIGEFGWQGNTVGPAAQNSHAIEFIRAAMEWGCPFILQWELYGNEVQDGRHKGYWLIDDKGQKWPVYYTFESFLKNARKIVSENFQSTGQVMDHDTFFRKGLELIAEASPESDKTDVADIEYRGFEDGDLEGWRTSGDSVEVVQDRPHSGQYHLKLESDGQPQGWSVASWVKPASTGETWHAEIKAARIKGILVKLKLAFYDENKRMLRQISRTNVETEYVTLLIEAEAPEGTASVHLVAAVETATREDPALGYFDDASLECVASD
jgi:hypothetical protein